MADFPSFKDHAGKQIVYVRPVAVSDLPEQVRSQVGDETELFAIHDQNGSRLALTNSRDNAFTLARINEFVPVSVH